MKRLLFALLVMLGLACIPHKALAVACSIPNTFTAGTPAVATQVNANFTSLQSCGNNIDHTNIGAAGIYASQIIPDTTGHATFGGTVAYTFSNGLVVNGGLTVGGITVSTCARYNGSGGLASASSDCPVGYNATGTVEALKIVSGSASIAFPGCTAGTVCGQTGTFTLPVTYTGKDTYSCSAGMDVAPTTIMGVTNSSSNTVTFLGLGQSGGWAGGTSFTVDFTCSGY